MKFSSISNLTLFSFNHDYDEYILHSNALKTKTSHAYNSLNVFISYSEANKRQTN